MNDPRSASSSLHANRRFLELLDALNDSLSPGGEALAADQRRELEDILLADATARAHYRSTMNLHLALRRLAAAGPGEAVTRRAVDLPDPPREVLPTPASRAARAWQSVYRFIAHPTSLSLLVAGLFTTVILLSLALLRPQVDVRDGESKPVALRPEFVGRFTRLAECEWSPATLERLAAAPKVGDDLERGHLLELLAGSLDLVLDSGAGLRIEGPAAFRATGKNRLEFIEGRLTALVPERAAGFTVAAAGATVVDLGTEFGISLSPLGMAEAHVFRGAVSVDFGGDGSASPRVFQLKQDEALRWNAAGGTPPERFSADTTRFPRRPPGDGAAKWFAGNSVDKEPQSALPFQPADDDLLQGLVPTVAPAMSLNIGRLEMLSDGRGSDPFQQGLDGRVIVENGRTASFQLIYDLGLPPGRAARVEQLRLFTYNTDARVFVDADLEGSLDGQSWQVLHRRLTNGRRGVDVNLPSGSAADYYHDYSVAWIERQASIPPVRYVRLTFRGPYEEYLFTTEPSTKHTSLTEIDLIGAIVPLNH